MICWYPEMGIGSDDDEIWGGDASFPLRDTSPKGNASFFAPAERMVNPIPAAISLREPAITLEVEAFGYSAWRPFGEASDMYKESVELGDGRCSLRGRGLSWH